MPALTSPELIWLAQALLFSLTLGLALSLVVGLLLLARPRALFTLNQRLSRWIDTKERFRELERPRLVERFFYRHHRVLGALIVSGAGYVLWTWAFSYQRSGLLSLLDARWHAAGMDWVVPAAESIVVILHAVVLIAGLVILLRPSLLKGLERAANRWHQGPPVEKLDTVIGSVDRGFELYPRLSGLILLLAASWSLSALLPVLTVVLGR